MKASSSVSAASWAVRVARPRAAGESAGSFGLAGLAGADRARAGPGFCFGLSALAVHASNSATSEDTMRRCVPCMRFLIHLVQASGLVGIVADHGSRSCLSAEMCARDNRSRSALLVRARRQGHGAACCDVTLMFTNINCCDD